MSRFVRNCFGVVGCEWCSYDNDARQSLSNAYCADSNVCPLGVVGGVTLYPSKAPTTNNPGEMLIVLYCQYMYRPVHLPPNV